MEQKRLKEETDGVVGCGVVESDSVELEGEDLPCNVEDVFFAFATALGLRRYAPPCTCRGDTV